MTSGKPGAVHFGMKPASMAADSAYGSADNLAWLVKQKEIAPHIPVFDKSNRALLIPEEAAPQFRDDAAPL